MYGNVVVDYSTPIKRTELCRVFILAFAACCTCSNPWKNVDLFYLSVKINFTRGRVFSES